MPITRWFPPAWCWQLERLHSHLWQLICKNLSVDRKTKATRKLTVPFRRCHASWHGTWMCADPRYGSMCRRGLDIRQERHLQKIPSADGTHCTTRKSWHTAMRQLLSTVIKKIDLLTAVATNTIVVLVPGELSIWLFQWQHTLTFQKWRNRLT